MIVVDASVLTRVDLEVASAVRRLTVAGLLDDRRARLALGDLLDLPIRRVSHRRLLARCRELRHSLTVYDGAYVALAEAAAAVLVTADARLAHAPGPRCEIELLGAIDR